MIVRRSHPRKGLTLVEIMAALATITMVTGVSVALLALLFKLSDTGRKHVANESAIARASRIFRQDIRSAEVLETRPSGKPSGLITLRSEDGTAIEYAAERDGVLRVETWDSFLISQERLVLSEKSRPRFESRSDAGQTLVSLVFDRRAGKSDSKLAEKPFRVDAVLDAGSRFDDSEGATR